MVIPKISFLVKMLISVFQKLFIFAIYYMMVIGAFAVMMNVVAPKIGNAYDQIGKAAIFLFAVRQSLGDPNTEDLIETTESDLRILVWILWFIILVIGNIVFMNFIIAVVNEAYADCIARRVQCVQLSMLEMIQEFELFMPKFYLDKLDDWFPRFIVVERPRNEDTQL